MITTTTTTPTVAPERAATDWLSGLRAMIGKELRQNAKWAALGLIALAVALAYAVGRALPGPNGGFTDNAFEQMWNDITTTFVLGAPAVALLLGLLQVLPEMRRDLWAFLIHRPAPRATLFWGKTCAGLLLYFAATLIPLGLCVLWVRTPGNVAAPFAPGLTLGALAGILLGVPFYFAGMLTALRPARWYGSRALPIPAAIVLAVLTTTLSEFWQAALASLIIAAVFCLAARGSFLTSGIYETQPRTARAALGIVVYIGMVVTLDVLAMLGFLAYSTMFPPLPIANPQMPQYQITSQGQVISAEEDSFGDLTDVHTLDGSPIQVPPGEKHLRAEDFLLPNYLNFGSDRTNFASPGRYARSVFDELEPHEQWYYTPGAGKFLDYDTMTRRLLRTMRLPGPPQPLVGIGSVIDAYVPGGDPLGFSGPLNTILAFEHALYQYRPLTLRIEPVTAPLAGAAVESITTVLTEGYDPAMHSQAQKDQSVVVGTEKSFLGLSPDGQFLFAVPLALPETQTSSVTIYAFTNGQRYFFWYHAARAQAPDQVFEYDGHGLLVRHVLLPPITGPEADNSAGAGSAIGLLVPPVICGPMVWIETPRSPGESHWAVLMHLPLEIKLLCLMSLLGGFPSAFLAWRIGLRCAYSRGGRWAWTFGAFWLGLSGPLLMLCLREWPARETCPNCGRRRVVTRTLCEHCSAPFAPVPRDGTEIFDASETMGGGR